MREVRFRNYYLSAGLGAENGPDRRSSEVALPDGWEASIYAVRFKPPWVQEMGLEWLFRLGSEPRRLWKRYLRHNPRFAYHTLREATSCRKPTAE